jgi:hypothetical protein
MSEQPYPQPPAVPEIQARLKDVAQLLRRSHSLDPAAQRALAELVEELSRTLSTQEVPAQEVTHLAESTAHLAESLHHQHDTGLLGKARQSLERAVSNAEVNAPVTVGVARRLLDALANLGI